MSVTETTPAPESAGEAQPPDRTRVKPLVFVGSAGITLVISIWAIITPQGAANVIGAAVGWISQWFGWYYFLTATLIVVFVVFIAASRYGKIKLGPQHSTPDYGLFAWAAMFFAAGIGVDLMFFSISGPVTNYLDPPQGSPETIEAARQAVVWTIFHYGITGWAMYALMGMALGYFAFRRRLPLAIRSALYPLIGKRIHGPAGDSVDLAAVIGAIFGIAVSLGIGVVQLSYGLNVMFDLPQGLPIQIALIVIAVLIATLSAVSGVDKGIRRISQLNVLLAVALMIYLSVFENPIQVLNSLVMNVGDFVSRFPGMTLDTFAYEQPTDWLNSGTLFFWAWWIAWAPFVGMFLARISRGRTIRQFVTATLVIPFFFALAFISVFGNAALRAVRGGDSEFGEAAVNVPEEGFFALLAQHPGATFSIGLAVVAGLLLYVTSADSGALVMANLSSHLRTPTQDAAPWLRIFWAAATGLLTLAMLLVDGIDALTNATIIIGLPFSVVMFLVMWGLYRALRVEGFRRDALVGMLPSTLSGRGGESASWRHRLARARSYSDRAAVEKFRDDVCLPALTEVAEELRAHGEEATVQQRTDAKTGLFQVELRSPVGAAEEFGYLVCPRPSRTPAFARNARNGDGYFRVEVFLADGGQGYDVMGYRKDQLIDDVLDHYERHLEFLRLRHEAAADPTDSAT
ncbi:choline/glycine/proline betaine transport protein [Tamaricihabitans halophyticus]|uniref:Choline/glycine/proline betaine transport protein n=1 Tax=Tamaricihabitans halophyticus TaxID=1262583 RepID=A0A4R2R0E6_9PSEU|nr:choline BCCT transporter BetT [Tamaricihabitans halophyticus]TCP55019.1 choline/glycine/proline betaine transport protein [Tamaricihabitans halophyticus]